MLPQGTRLVDTEWGKVCVYSKDDCISATIAGGTFWDGPLLLPFYEKYSNLKKVAIEIGAFSGIGALYLSSRNEGVVAVEPVHGGLLRATVEANGLKNVTCLNGAAYSDGGWMLPAADEMQGQAVAGVSPWEIDNPGGVALVRVGNEMAQAAECVQAFKLDKWVEDWEEVGLIKSDAQGCDLRALKGLKRTIERCRPAILFEFEEGLARLHGDDWKGHVDYFEEMNYSLEDQGDKGYFNNWIALPR